MTKERGILAIVAVSVVLAVACGIFLYTKNREEKADQKEKDVSSTVDAGAAAGNLFAGVVEAEKVWSVRQEEDRIVSEVLVAEGDEVRQGEPLFRYDTEKMQDDLAQAQIDLQRLQHEKQTISGTLAELTREKQEAEEQEQARYTLEIQEQQLEASQKEIEIKEKTEEIRKLTEEVNRATVTSEIDGVVKSIHTTPDEDHEEDALMTIVQTSALRVKATVNEQNIADIEEGMAVIVRSRLDDTTWNGTISRIDFDGTQRSEEETGSSGYPFYIQLESSEGLMLGQHVFVEPVSGEEGHS